MSGKEAHEMMAERQEILDGMTPEDTSTAVTKIGDDTVAGAVRLQLDFPTPAALVQFVDELRMELIPEDVSLYAIDSLDANMSDSNVFAMRRTGDRPESRRLKLFRTYEIDV